MEIPEGVILIWPSTNASIPSGWTRETTLDGKYPKAWGTSNPNVSGGANTHTHSGGGHTHTLSSHSHTCNLDFQEDHLGNEPGTGTAQYLHTHTATVTTITGGSLQSTTVTWASVNQEPAYYTVIFIKPTSGLAFITAGVCGHYYGDSVPTGWYYCDGTNGTPNLSNKYLKGAAASGDSGTTGGGTSHSHTVSHGHTADAHSHSSASGGRVGNTLSSAAGPSVAHETHTHTVTLANTTDTVSDYTNTTAGSGDTVEIAYKKMGVIYRSTGGMPKGLIGLWLGATASVPIGWYLCNGSNGTPDLRDKYIKIGTSLAQNSDTGGANTHTHTSVSHTHTATGTHTHTGSTGGPSATAGVNGDAGEDSAISTHTHTVSSVQSVTATYANTSLTADTVSNEPAYLTAAYIMYAFSTGGGSLLNFI